MARLLALAAFLMLARADADTGSQRASLRRSRCCSCTQEASGAAAASEFLPSSMPAPSLSDSTPRTTSPLFIIVMMTYDRPQGHDLAVFNRSIASILQQTNPDWQLYITGDDYPPAKVATLHPILSQVPATKLHWANLNTPGERGRWPGGTNVWSCAGAAAANYGLERVEMGHNPVRGNMVAPPVVMTHLDDDDSWAPDHLDVLAQTYDQFPNSSFVYTRSIFHIAPFPAYSGHVAYNNYPPRAGNLIHNSASWRLADFYGWRYRTCNTTAEPVDADMWDRMAKYMSDNGMKSVFNPRVTTYHLTERGQV